MKLIIIFILLFSISVSGQRIRVVPHHPIAKIVSVFFQEEAAITVGNIIFVSCSRKEFIEDKRWVKHEITHVNQYKRYGLIGFWKRYFAMLIIYGYNNHPMENEK